MAQLPAAPDPPRHRVLVVEDDDGIRTLLEATLRLSGYEARAVAGGGAGLLEVERFHPELILLDVMLPDMDGFEVTRALRASAVATPVLFLSARTDVDDRITGLRAGGDDYVGKPFNIDEVLLRIDAILRRTGPDGPGAAGGPAPAVLRFADLELDEDAHEVRRAGTFVDLSPTEFSLLAYLLANPNRVLSRRQILAEVWGSDFTWESRNVETYIRYLRRKIDCFDPPLIHTVRGIGYSLRLPRGGQAVAERP